MGPEKLLSVEEARQVVLDHGSVLASERVSLLDALGRVLAGDARSDVDIAPFDNSAMDGFAVRATDGCADLAVVDLVPAGAVPRIPVGPGQAIRIMTGAPLPQGADAVAMVEYVRVLSGDGSTGSTVRLERPVSGGENVRRKGEDVREGSVVLSAGSVVNAAAVGLLAATGNPRVAVFRRPRVAVLSTGSELVEPDEPPGPGQIRNSNTLALAAQVLDAGGIPVIIGTVRDTEAATRAAFTEAARCDVAVVSGGVSVGDFDFVRPILEELGRIVFHRVDMRPGQPQTFGMLQGVPFFGLPGNPTSAFLGFELFARPLLRWMQGFLNLDRPRITALLDADVKKKPDQRHFHRARVRLGDDGVYHAAVTGSQSSALLSPMVRATALLDLPKGTSRFVAGTPVSCIRLDLPEESS